MLNLFFILLAAISAPGATTSATPEKVIVDFTPGFALSTIEQNGVKSSLQPGSVLRVESGHTIAWPGITINGKWDISGYSKVAMDLANPGTATVWVGLRVDNPDGQPPRNCVQEVFPVAPGERKTVATKLVFRMPDSFKLFGMNGNPGFGSYAAGDNNLDPSNVVRFIIFVSQPKEDHVFEISRIRASGPPPPPLPKAEEFFPFIDRFGQYIHQDWPGKLKSADDFPVRIAEEEKDLVAHPRPSNRDKWGGWNRGPKLKATGFFRTEKRAGNWWLVDPDGRLFFSYGIDCVGNWAGTIVTDRDRWFKALPANDPEFKEFFGEENSRENSHWKGAKVRVFDVGAANARAKYGKQWKDTTVDLAHRRLASWGFNTIGMWTGDQYTLKRRTPYVGTIHWWTNPVEGSWAKKLSFYDTFDPEFRKNIMARMESEKGKTAGDPWCVGYFIDNELNFGSDTDIALATLASPSGQAAKKAFIGDLRKKYRDIATLNRSWTAEYASWDELSFSRTPPGGDAPKPDLVAFTGKFYAAYFRECRDAVKRAAPHQLYLGSRFSGWNDPAVAGAAQYCDVVSFNMYWRSVADFKLPTGADKPVIIGEFHFGALDRGVFHTGLQGAENQEDRARLFREYITGVLRTPAFVGCAWFQYCAQPNTGRFDGENYQIGFVDICDTPYPEIIAASREIGANLYELRK
jgi:hypothetical protein